MWLFYRLTIYISILLPFCAIAQNDDACSVSSTHDLGVLPNPLNCPSNNFSDSVVVSDNTANYTAENGRPSLLACKTFPVAGSYDMDPTSHDTWYKFEASGNDVQIDIRPIGTSFLSNPVIGIYHYTGSCYNLIPMDCSKGTASGQLHFQNANLIPYEIYYIQVTGATAADTGNFQMIVKNRNTCLECMQDSYLDPTPKPLNGYYAPGTQVMFTYVVKGYKPYAGNALKAIIPQFGNGWDQTTLTTYPPQPVSGFGNWAYTTQTIASTNYTGFFYQNSVFPGGDAGNQNSTWVFKWSISTKANCTAGNNLNISILNYADKEINNLNTVCSLDPDFIFKSKTNCCTPPSGVGLTAAQGLSCNDSCDASIGITNSQGGNYNVVILEQSSGSIIQSNYPLQTTGPTFISGFCAGQYNIVVVDPLSTCSAIKSFSINPPVSYVISQTQQSCYSTCLNKASISISGTGSITHVWVNVPPINPSNANTLVNLCHDSTYVVKITNNSGPGTCVFFDSITIVGIPTDDATINYPLVACNQSLISPYIATPGGHFYSLTTPLIMDSVTGVIDCTTGQPNNGIIPGSYDVMYITKSACLDTGYATIDFVGLFNSQFTYPGKTFCKNIIQVQTTSGPIGGNYSYSALPANSTNHLSLNNITGSFNPSQSDTGKYAITYYTTPSGSSFGPCDSYSTDTITINSLCDSIIHVFNSFTPNNDGKNDSWTINGIDGKENTVSIFNRWGMLVWEQKNYNNEQNHWQGYDKNGKPLFEGTYYYLIQVKGDPIKKGWVELMR